MNRPKIALNTMVVADCFHTQNFETVLKEVARLGVESVEISQHIPFAQTDAFLLEQPGMPGVCGFSVQMDGMVANPVPPMYFEGKPLPVYSARKDFEGVAALCRQLRCPYVRYAGLPGAALTHKETLLAYLEDLENLALAYREEGLGLCLHNHAEEFIRVEGRWLLDWALEQAPHLLLELDLLNAQKVGVSPTALLERCAGRVPLVHLQDLAVLPSSTGEWLKPQVTPVPLGQGNLPLKEIWQASCRAGVEYLVLEQWPLGDMDPYQAVRLSVEALKAL